MSILAEYRWYFLIGARLYFGYQLSVSFTPLRIPFEKGEFYYGDCTTHK